MYIDYLGQNKLQTEAEMTTFESSVCRNIWKQNQAFTWYMPNKSFAFGWQTHSVLHKLHLYLITASTYQKKFGNYEEGIF